MKPIRVNMSVTSDDPNVIARAIEAMSRATAGLCLEGVPVWLMTCTDEEEDE